MKVLNPNLSISTNLNMWPLKVVASVRVLVNTSIKELRQSTGNSYCTKLKQHNKAHIEELVKMCLRKVDSD